MVGAVNRSISNEFRPSGNAYQYSGVNYVQSVPKNIEQDTFISQVKEQLPWIAAFEGYPFVRFLMRNKKLNGIMTQDILNLTAANKSALVNIVKGKNGNILQRIGQYIKAVNKNREVYHEIKSVAKAKIKAPILAEKAAKAAEKAAQNPGFFANRAAVKTAAKAERAAETAAKKITAATVKNGAVQAAKTGTLGKIKNFFKTSGAGIMLAFNGLIEGLTEIYPAFKNLGFNKGMKQLGKSTVKVIGDTAGFIAGEQIGTAIGSAIGTAICPVIGTAAGAAMGAVVGFIGGCIGSHYAGKVTKAITGKSEMEIAKEQQEKNMLLSNNPFNVVV